MAMQPQSSFDALSRVLERIGSGDRTVRRAEAAAGGDTDGPLRATVEVEIPLSEVVDAGARSDSDRLSADVGTADLEITLSVPIFPSGDGAIDAELPDETSVSTHVRDVQLADGNTLVTLTVTIDTASSNRSGATSGVAVDSRTESTETSGSQDDFTRGGARATTSELALGETTREAAETTEEAAETTQEYAESTQATAETTQEIGDADSTDSTDSLVAARDESVPPYDDTAYLRRLYDVCDTFEEMSRRIDMDVSAETVRRYMIDAGVHSPASYETSSGDSSTGTATADEPARDPDHIDVSTDSLPDEQLVTDGIGFPERLTLHDVVDAVLEARTVHEVGRDLGLEHDRTRRLLRQLNVLDLVLRRVSADPEREVSTEDVAARIRESAPDAS
ncbi:hypothetical protein [Halobellus salinisoli]|uniref:hypothetical protein n=1 Tax=Halobellus salinisoli TaxID=3108500 RepID=UPI003009F9A8